MTGNTELHETAKRLVDREVHCCMSSLVATLAAGYGDTGNPVSGRRSDLASLTEQALELASPVLDYESAAREEYEAGRDYQIVSSEEEPGSFEWRLFTHGAEVDREGFFLTKRDALVAAMACRDEMPELEVYEHWSVSTWLAEKLIAKGERVDRDFAGLCVWARTTTRQTICIDAVIEAIAADLLAAS